MKMMGSVGSFCGPFLIGALTDANGGSFVPAMLVLSGVLFLAAGMHLLIREPGRTFIFIFIFTFLLHCFNKNLLIYYIGDLLMLEPDVAYFIWCKCTRAASCAACWCLLAALNMQTAMPSSCS